MLVWTQRTLARISSVVAVQVKGCASVFQCAGGEWHGLLFDNPSLRLPPSLTWCFNFPFEDVSREDDYSPLSLCVEWLPVPAESWRRIAGHRLTSAKFAEPAEASVYYYVHHRFDTVDLDLVEQRDRALRAVATVSGDLDRSVSMQYAPMPGSHSPGYSSRCTTRPLPMSPLSGSVSSLTRPAWYSTPTAQRRRCDSSHHNRTDPPTASHACRDRRGHGHTHTRSHEPRSRAHICRDKRGRARSRH
jgi:hypothetical protein